MGERGEKKGGIESPGFGSRHRPPPVGVVRAGTGRWTGYTASMPARLYLRLGDRVCHTEHEEWGEGAVVEEMTSVLEGGTCLVRVMFADGRQRTFHNDLESDLCCYFFGVRKQWRGAAGALLEPEAPRGRAPRRRLP